MSGYSQEKEKVNVKGVLLDRGDMSPVRGATVRSLLTNTNVVKSTENGNFTILGLQKNDSLLVSSVGYNNQIVPIGYFDSNSNLLLVKSDQYLEEVEINTGYQTLKSNEVTGAADVISNKMLNQQTGTNILQRLNNIVPAIRFDNQPIQNPFNQKLNISVRGLSTINGNLDPLIVLDGFIYEGNIGNIDPNMIETVTVLKDAAASAIWGARAGNGVIVLTTKNGNLNSQKSKISFSSTLLFKGKSDLSKLYRTSNKDFIDIEKMLFDNGYYDVLLNFAPYVPMTPAVDIFDKRKHGLLSAQDSATVINNLLKQNGLKNYVDAFYDNPLTQQYALNVSGGSLKNSYGIGLGYMEDRSQLSDKTKKLNVLISNSFRPVEKLRVDLKINYSSTRNLSGKPEYTSLTYGSKAVPYMQFYDSDGYEIPFERDFRQLYLDQNYSDNFLDWSYFPVSENSFVNTTSRQSELYATASASYQLLPFINLMFSGQYQLQSIAMDELSTIDSYKARSIINQFTQVDPNTLTASYPVPRSGLKASSQNHGQSFTVRSQIGVNKHLGEHHLVGVLGAEIRENELQGSSFTAYGYKDRPLTSVAVDHVSLYRTNPDNLYQTVLGAPDFSKTINRFISTYANFSNIWKEKYAVSISYRQDGANIFGAKTNDRWAPLWAIGGYWDLGKEDFIKLPWIDRLKLRTTFGYSGNVDVSKTSEPIANINTGKYSNLPSLTIRTLNDPALRWEKVSTLNVAIDYAFLKGRITGSLDYYRKIGNDLYGNTEYDYSTWGLQQTIVKNVGAMKGQGLDWAIHTVNTNGKLNWISTFNFSVNKSITTAYYLTTNQGLSRFFGNGNNITPIVGKPLNAIAAYRWGGLNDQGEAQGYLDGKLSTDYRSMVAIANGNIEDNETVAFVGSSKPQQFGNFINTFTWNNFSISVNLSYKTGYYFQKPATSYFSLYSNGVAYIDFESRWKKVGDEKHTDMPKMVYPLASNADSFYTKSDIHVLKGDHIRLEYINLSWQTKLNFGKRDIFPKFNVNLSNLGIVWRANKLHIDPEFAYRLSPPKVFSLGLQLDL